MFLWRERVRQTLGPERSLERARKEHGMSYSEKTLSGLTDVLGNLYNSTNAMKEQ